MLCMLCMYGKTGQHVLSFTGRFIESDASKNFSREAPAKEKSHLEHEDTRNSIIKYNSIFRTCQICIGSIG